MNESKQITSFKDLLVWQRAVIFVTKIYTLTNTFPKTETFSLIDQLRRAAVSIASNIAEGKQRQTKKEYIQFLHIAYGSCAEVYTQLIISKNLGYFNEKSLNNFLDELLVIEKMLSSLIKKLKSLP